ncbi:coat protein [ssRNA phage SRR6960507_2]|uniref:Coat protein n=1 Tax=ssRNA phage SRR6960507_2 TaxID=2786512 RepID=A0A8S5KXY6_9VIRU|nr:coat protein [ssRNA phage SRR6960507_2]DAD50638.1 TPA_asm: coat protein [ssRNA phage SRR6960507_2]
MAARGNLILKDRASPVVNHTYTPDGDDTNNVHVYSEKSGVPAGNPQFTIALKKTSDTWRPTIRLKVPVVQTQTINGISSPVVIRTALVEVNFVFSALSTPQERADAVGLIVESLQTAQTQINDTIVNLSDVY